jgi:hypothetical protein
MSHRARAGCADLCVTCVGCASTTCLYVSSNRPRDVRLAQAHWRASADSCCRAPWLFYFLGLTSLDVEATIAFASKLRWSFSNPGSQGRGSRTLFATSLTRIIGRLHRRWAEGRGRTRTARPLGIHYFGLRLLCRLTLLALFYVGPLSCQQWSKYFQATFYKAPA